MAAVVPGCWVINVSFYYHMLDMYLVKLKSSYGYCHLNSLTSARLSM